MNSSPAHLVRGKGGYWGLKPPPEKSAQKIWVYLFAEMFSMCSLRMLL